MKAARLAGVLLALAAWGCTPCDRPLEEYDCNGACPTLEEARADPWFDTELACEDEVRAMRAFHVTLTQTFYFDEEGALISVEQCSSDPSSPCNEPCIWYGPRTEC